MKRATPAALVLLLGLALSVRPAFAQETPSEIIQIQIADLEELMGSEGYVLWTEPIVGSLAPAGRTEISLDLESSRSFYVWGVCDEGCSDLDLVLRDAQGRTLDEDTLPDDFPLLEVETADGEGIRLTVVMVECRTDSCQYGVAFFSR